MMKNSLFRTCGKLFQIVQNIQGIGLIFISKGSSKFRPKIRANLFVRLIVGRLWNLRFLFLVSSFRRLLINLLSWKANFFHRLNISLLLACIHLAKSPWKWMLIYKFLVVKTLNKQDMTPVAGKNQRIKSPWSKHREIARLKQPNSYFMMQIWPVQAFQSIHPQRALSTFNSALYLRHFSPGMG